MLKHCHYELKLDTKKRSIFLFTFSDMKYISILVFLNLPNFYIKYLSDASLETDSSKSMLNELRRTR